MKMLSIDVVCDKCQHVNNRQVVEIEPEKFSANGSKSLLSQYWCSECEGVQVVRYEFYRDKNREIKVRLKCRIEETSTLVPKVPSTGITVRARASKPGNR